MRTTDKLFSKKGRQTASQHMKDGRWATPFIVRRMQTKTMVKYHFTLSRTIIKKKKKLTGQKSLKRFRK